MCVVPMLRCYNIVHYSVCAFFAKKKIRFNMNLYRKNVKKSTLYTFIDTIRRAYQAIVYVCLSMFISHHCVVYVDSMEAPFI